MIAGAGDLGRTVAESLVAHSELGYRVVGFVDEDPEARGVAGLPVLGRLDETTELATRHRVDQLYIALPLDAHARLLGLIKSVRNECLDIKVVPDLLQYASIKASLEDLDGVPIISLNEVPLRGWNSMAKRFMDASLAAALLVFFTLVVPIFPAIWLLIFHCKASLRPAGNVVSTRSTLSCPLSIRKSMLVGSISVFAHEN